MVVYDDFDGVYFTIQSLRLYHPEVLDKIEFVVIDNNPSSNSGKNVNQFLKWVKEPAQYIAFGEYSSTSVRNKVFEHAKTEYVLCIDCHVLIYPAALDKLIQFLNGTDDLIQGPMIYDNLEGISTHMNPIWRDGMYGTWGVDKRGVDVSAPPFEIPMQGLGLFCCKKNSWLGFNKSFRGFGGEEGYIHEKYRYAGRKTLCLPFLRWVHRFQRPRGVPYPLRIEDRIINYFIGHLELGLDCAPIFEHFSTYSTSSNLNRMYDFSKTKATEAPQ